MAATTLKTYQGDTMAAALAEVKKDLGSDAVPIIAFEGMVTHESSGRRRAEVLGVPFSWRLEVVDGVGHDYRRMGEAAAEYLYGAEAGRR